MTTFRTVTLASIVLVVSCWRAVSNRDQWFDTREWFIPLPELIPYEWDTIFAICGIVVAMVILAGWPYFEEWIGVRYRAARSEPIEPFDEDTIV